MSEALPSATNAPLAGRLDTLVASGRVEVTGTGASRNIHAPELGVYATSASLTSQLGSYALTSAMNAALAGKLDTLTGSGCTISGVGAARTIAVPAPDLSAYATTASLETYAALNYVQENLPRPMNNPTS